MKSCPFCKKNDIKFSVTTTQIAFKRAWHLAMYCNNCHCYGPRVLVHQEGSMSRHTLQRDPQYRNMAEQAWNSGLN